MLSKNVSLILIDQRPSTNSAHERNLGLPSTSSLPLFGRRFAHQSECYRKMLRRFSSTNDRRPIPPTKGISDYLVLPAYRYLVGVSLTKANAIEKCFADSHRPTTVDQFRPPKVSRTT